MTQKASGTLNCCEPIYYPFTFSIVYLHLAISNCVYKNSLLAETCILTVSRVCVRRGDERNSVFTCICAPCLHRTRAARCDATKYNRTHYTVISDAVYSGCGAHDKSLWVSPRHTARFSAVPDERLASWNNRGNFWFAKIISRCQSFVGDSRNRAVCLGLYEPDLRIPDLYETTGSEKVCFGLSHSSSIV